MTKQYCPICNFSSETSELHETSIPGTRETIVRNITCPRCGSYSISDSVIDYLRAGVYHTSPRKLFNLSSWIHENQSITIHSNNIEQLLQLQPRPIAERIHNLLLFIVNQTSYIGEDIYIDCNDPVLLATTWSLNRHEVAEFFSYLIDNQIIRLSYNIDDALRKTEFIEMNSGNIEIAITPTGWKHIESLSQTNTNSSQGFVAMWFAESMINIYEKSISPAISDAGYRPIRIDKHEHNNDITDEIIAQIRRSKFLVADYTGHRGGVYYEAGFARGIGIEVFMTCRKDEITQLHFDVNHRICIEWTEDNPGSLRKQLANKIEATLGRGPFIKNA